MEGRDSKGVSGWEQVNEILSRIKPPVFPDKDFNIADFGAVGDGRTDCTEAFKNAIAAAHEAGGGRVVVPKGTFMTGAIHLASNVNLHLANEDSVIKFSKDPKMYLPSVYTRWEGVECMNYSPLVYAYEQENLAITGKGLLDGNSSFDDWWQWKRTQGSSRDELFKYGEQGVPVEKRQLGGKLLRPAMIEPYKCKNVLIEGVRIKEPPFWQIHPVLSQNITVRNVKISGHGPNNDGCNIESCKNVLVKGCEFDTGDDCIPINAGRNNDGRRVNVPCENIVVQDCKMKDGHGGVVMGSMMTAGVRNVFAENCVMDSPHLDYAIRLKTNSQRGGFIENVYVRNITINEVGGAILRVNFFYEEGDTGPHTPWARNINLENITSKKSKYVLLLNGYERSPITDVTLRNCTLDNIRKPSVISNVKNLVFENVRVNGKLVVDPVKECTAVAAS